jgi:hypothetical protein
MSATADSSRRTAGEGGGKGRATAFVSGFKTNPVDASFLNGHMIRAMDYNDICPGAVTAGNCKKLQSYIMSMETAKDLGGLFELTTSR